MSSGKTIEKSVDPEVLRQKYREERDKRLRVKDRGSYRYLEGELAHYGDNPWASSDGARDPVVRDVEAVVAGGGFAGLLAGARLRKRGIEAQDVCVIDRGSDFGGTWYWNRYPGLSCDTESYIYLPLLEETNYIPREKYATGPEIFEHAQRIGRHFDLYKGALFQTQVSDAQWDESARRWIVRTDRGDQIRARYLFLCGGGTNRPKLPGIPGFSEFKGHSFHTMRWDYAYTGGGPTNAKLDKLADKRVGIIGTGATAIQCVPPLGESAKTLHVFQRTPSAVNVRANRQTDPDWAAQLEPGWQMQRMENFLNIVSGTPQDVDLVDDAWTWNFRNVMRIFEEDKSRKTPKEVQEIADFERMEFIRRRVDEVVTDAKTAEALKAWYGLLCKRPTFHDGYLPAFNRPNVFLVDTNGAGVERITEKGVVAGGKEYELDCIIFATGFDTTAPLTTGMGVNPKGVSGEALSDRWAREWTTLHGIHVSGFPNLFIIGGGQGPLATTLTYGLDVQTEHCARIVEHCRARGLNRVEVKPDAEYAWRDVLAEKGVDHKEYFRDCTPGYYNLEGGDAYVWEFFYGGGAVDYRRVLNRWLDNGLERDLEFRD